MHSVNIKYVRTQRGIKVKITHLLPCTTRSEGIPTSTHLNLDTGERWAVSWCRPLYHRCLLNKMLGSQLHCRSLYHRRPLNMILEQSASLPATLLAVPTEYDAGVSQLYCRPLYHRRPLNMILEQSASMPATLLAAPTEYDTGIVSFIAGHFTSGAHWIGCLSSQLHCRPLYHWRPMNMILDGRKLWRREDSLSPAGNPTIPCSSSL